MGIFRSAISGPDGSVDAGYLGLYAVMGIVLGAIPAVITLMVVRMFIMPDHPLDLMGLAAIVGAATAGFGTAAAGVGLFRAGDRNGNKVLPPAEPPASPPPAA